MGCSTFLTILGCVCVCAWRCYAGSRSVIRLHTLAQWTVSQCVCMLLCMNCVAGFATTAQPTCASHVWGLPALCIHVTQSLLVQLLYSSSLCVGGCGWLDTPLRVCVCFNAKFLHQLLLLTCLKGNLCLRDTLAFIGHSHNSKFSFADLWVDWVRTEWERKSVGVN